jgi:uncharacterized protein YjeT (DUF2065 family)
MSGIISLLLSVAGLGLMTATSPEHWQQMPAGIARKRCPATLLRMAGLAALFASLMLCLSGGPATIGAIVWVVELAVGASIVAAALAARTA